MCNISYGNLPVGLGNCPDICVRRLAGCDACSSRGRKRSITQLFEFGATDPLDPPTLLAGTGTADAFVEVPDLATGLSEKRICIGIDCLHILPLGSPTPAFSAVFCPVSAFHEAGRILTLPQRRKRHTGATVGNHPHGRHQINNATMQVTPMVIFLSCNLAEIYNAERTNCNVAIFTWGSAKTISYRVLW